MRLLRLFRTRGARIAPEHVRTDEHGYTWATREFFGFGDLSKQKDSLNLSHPTAEQFLRSHGDTYPWREVWLEHGRTYPAPSRELCLRINKANGHIPGNCYNNALRLALGMHGTIILPSVSEVLYGEGIAVNPTGAYLHAWLVVNGHMYDPTWPDAYRASYFGITVGSQWMLDFAETVGSVSLLRNWEHSRTLLDSLFEQGMRHR